ncbi:hypothetical protein I79_000286 [Cricetulus griseus]|uniref:Uncharacterized protein n=1 Tax=Cricetulus griseus TaxID=10029 RepID=G3GRZ1_CRIGR|nr:hypothetical protein I79_000286 [Cricetulus griseus]
MDHPPSQVILSLQAAQPKAFDDHDGMLGTLVTKGCCGCPSVFQLNQSLGEYPNVSLQLPDPVQAQVLLNELTLSRHCQRMWLQADIFCSEAT